MFELPEFITLTKQINEVLPGKVIQAGTLGNSPHKFVWYNRSHKEFAQLTPCPSCGAPIEKLQYLGGACYICPHCQT